VAGQPRRFAGDARLTARARDVRPGIRVRGRRPETSPVRRRARPLPGLEAVLRVPRVHLLEDARRYGRGGVRSAVPGPSPARRSVRVLQPGRPSSSLGRPEVDQGGDDSPPGTARGRCRGLRPPGPPSRPALLSLPGPAGAAFPATSGPPSAAPG